MLLVDTSVWVDHFRATDVGLVQQLEAGTVMVHPFVIGEIALGSIRQRHLILSALEDLPTVPVAHHPEVLALIASR